jgi:hypothetical protein
VEASNPTVTYKYRNDDELIQANHAPSHFANASSSLPRTASFAMIRRQQDCRFECPCGGVCSYPGVSQS